MTQYISKSAVVREIKRRRHVWRYGSSIEAKYKREECDDFLSFLDILEVKEVKEEPESIWHDANKQPTMYRKYLVRYSDGRVSGSWERHDDGFIPWKDVVKEHGFTHWCYVEDLLKL